MVIESTSPVIGISEINSPAIESGAVEFAVNLRHSAAGTYKFNYSVTQEGDFLDSSVDTTNTILGELIFTGLGGNQFRGNLNLPLNDDTMREAAGSVTVTLEPSDANTPLNYVIAKTNQQTINVNDNDPIPTISVSDFIVADVDGTTNFVVKLSNPTYQPVSLTYTLDVNSTAMQGVDFAFGASSPLIIDPGEITGMIPITIMGDTNSNEGQEAIILNLIASNATFAGNLATSLAVGSITDYPIVLY